MSINDSLKLFKSSHTHKVMYENENMEYMNYKLSKVKFAIKETSLHMAINDSLKLFNSSHTHIKQCMYIIYIQTSHKCTFIKKACNNGPTYDILYHNNLISLNCKLIKYFVSFGLEWF